MQTKAYAGRLKNRDELIKSSSGGAYTALSDSFLNNGDAVVSSIYDYNDDKLKYFLFTDKTSRDKARGSKYFQSDPNHVFKDCETWLEGHSWKRILFVGTGCQAEAFRVFMKEKGFSDRIFTVDIICYGVVSPQLWQDYLEYKLSDHGPGRKKQYSNLTFKDKRNGWNHPSAFFQENNREVAIDDYVKIFYSKLALRKSCYKCPYTDTERKTDITIGDFWGIDKKIPEFYDSMGNSLFLVHTERGQALFDSICDSIDYKESCIEECMQSHLEHPTECPEDRENFWKLYKRKGIYSVMKKYATAPLYRKAREKIKKILRKH